MIETYLGSRENLRGIVHIMDLRHPPSPEDINFRVWLKEAGIPVIPVLTKADKLPRSKWGPLVRTAGQILGASEDEFIIFSAQTKQGRNELLRRLKGLLGI
jgi:GTP-binding protein